MKRFFLAVISLVYLIPTMAQAQSYLGPASRATGNTGRAAVSPIDSAYLNPASVSYLNRYYIGGSYYTETGRNDDRLRGWSAHVTDANAEAMVAASLGYLSETRDVGSINGVERQDVLLALSGIVYQGISFGLAGHHLIQRTFNEKYYSNNLNIGFLFAPTPNLGVGVVGYDVLQGNDDTPVVLRPKNALGLGVSYFYDKTVRFKVDVVRQEAENPEHKIGYGLGIETFMIPEFAVRIGYNNDELQERKLYTAGFGFEGPKFSVDYAAQVVDGKPGTSHFVDLWLTF